MKTPQNQRKNFSGRQNFGGRKRFSIRNERQAMREALLKRGCPKEDIEGVIDAYLREMQMHGSLPASGAPAATENGGREMGFHAL